MLKNVRKNYIKIELTVKLISYRTFTVLVVQTVFAEIKLKLNWKIYSLSLLPKVLWIWYNVNLAQVKIIRPFIFSML